MAVDVKSARESMRGGCSDLRVVTARAATSLLPTLTSTAPQLLGDPSRVALAATFRRYFRDGFRYKKLRAHAPPC
eukprot:95374-Amphidinium_carterae.1